MNNAVKSIRHIQVKNIAYHPNLFKAIITYEAYPSVEYDESDDLEYQKSLINVLVGDRWFYKNQPGFYEKPSTTKH
jgi:hypothetical protein